MKKLFKISLALILCVTAFSALAFTSLSADGEEPYTIIEDRDTATITIVINESASGDLTIDLGDVLNAAGQDSYVPGDTQSGAKLKIVNNSNYKYSYLDNSILVGAGVLGETSGALTGVNDFNGLPLRYRQVGSIVNNGALKNVATVLNGTEKLTFEQVYNMADTLATFDEKYAGIENPLSQYYLDFYNAKYNETATSLTELSLTAQYDMFNGYLNNFATSYYATKEERDARYNEVNTEANQKGVFYKNSTQSYLAKSGTKGIKADFRHTEAPLMQATNYYLYKYCFAVTFNKIENEFATEREFIQNYNFTQYSIPTSYANQAANTLFQAIDVESGAETGNIVDNAQFIFSGFYTNNTFQNFDLSYYAQITLEQEVKGSITVEKTINLNNYATSDDPVFLFELTNNDTEEVFYRFISLTDIALTGSATFTDLPLGNYTVHEFNPIRYSSATDQSTELTRANPDQTISFSNTKTKDNDFSDSDAVINKFTKNEDGSVTITPEKVKVTETE